MTAGDWLGPVLQAARPKAMAALVRYFRDIDAAEEALQEASLRALRSWPANGPPRDAAAWLILVGRNAGVDRARRKAREAPLEAAGEVGDGVADADAMAVERIEAADYRDDILRLLFVCCEPSLATSQQIALALRIVSGLTVGQIARAFLVSDAAMEQRITRAKARIQRAGVPFEAPGPVERGERLGAVAAMIYLVFNEGYTREVGGGGEASPLTTEAIRLGRMLLQLFPTEPEVMGLVALMLLAEARAPARFARDGSAVPLDRQDRTRWDRRLVAEGLALVDKAMRHRQPGAYQVQAAISAVHARAARAEETDWRQIAILYAALEHMTRSPVVTLNRAVAVAKSAGPAEALALVEPLADELDGYFYFHGVRGSLLKDLGRSAEAREALGRAIGLAGSAAEAAHIRGELDQLAGEAGTAEKKS